MPVVEGFPPQQSSSTFGIYLFEVPVFIQSFFNIQALAFHLVYGLIGLGVQLALLLIVDKVIIKWKTAKAKQA